MRKIKNVFKCLMLTLTTFIIVVFLCAYCSYSTAIRKLPVNKMMDVVKEKCPNYIKIEDVSRDLLNATYAVEDRRFYDRKGIDYRAIGRAMLANIKEGGFVEGGSTIDQQLIKIIYYDYERDIINKLAEFFFVEEVNDTYTKDEILEMYINIINYGDGYIGIGEASKGYFGKEPKDLTLCEASLLAGIPNSPYNYQLSNANPKTYERQKKVLGDMFEIGKITEDELRECEIITDKNSHDAVKAKKILDLKSS